MINDFIEYSFLRNAVICALLASVICGVMGAIIIERKLVMMSGGIAHSSFGGIGFGYLIGIEPIIGGLIFSVLASLGIIYIRSRTYTDVDTLMGMFWSAGMALGILFIAITPGYPPDMTSYLFGNILMVSRWDLVVISVLTIIILFSVLSFYHYWKVYLFDEDFAKVIGIRTGLLENFLFVLISLTIVALIKVVGIILLIALLTIPPAITKIVTYSFEKIMIFSILVGCLFCVMGLVFSYLINIPSGAAIILVSTIGYFLASIIVTLHKKTKEKTHTTGVQENC